MTAITRNFEMAKIVVENGEEVICMKEECGEILQNILVDGSSVSRIEYFNEKYSMPVNQFIQIAKKVKK